jgi:outer membrane protein TolC
MRRRLSLLVVGSVLSIAPTAGADEPERASPPAPVPADAPTTPPEAAVTEGAPVLRLTLADAARMGCAANLRLMAGAYDSPIARARVDEEIGAFDTLLTAGVHLSHTETPATSSFFGRDVVEDEGVRVGAGVERRLLTGGTVSFLYRADRLSTDSLFVTTNPSWTQAAVVEARQPLLRGAGDVAVVEIRRARNGVRVADETQRALTEEILLEIAVAYWDLTFAIEQVAARTKAEELARELLDETQAKLEAEVGTPLDVAEARAGFEQRRGDRIAVEAVREAEEDRLRALIFPFSRREFGTVDVVPLDDPRIDRGASPEPHMAASYALVALQQRGDVQASLAELSNRRLDVLLAYDGLRPQLDLVGRASADALAPGYGDSLTDVVEPEATSASIGVEFSMFLGRRSA